MNYNSTKLSVKTGNVRISMQKLACFLLLVGLYSVGTISSMLGSWYFMFAIVLLSVVAFSLSVSSKGMKIKRNTLLLWIVPLFFCFFGSLRMSYYQDIIMYTLVLALLLQISQYSEETIRFMLKAFVVSSSIFAFGEYWQYFNLDVYYKYIFPLFTSFTQQSIRRQLYYHRMFTGFTAQTIISAEFILLGIIVVLYYFPTLTFKRRKTWSVILIVFLLGALLLTGKRSPLVLLVFALVYTEVETTPVNKRLSHTLKILIALVFIVLVGYSFILPRFFDSRNGVVRIIELFDDDSDASNGRFELYANAISGFVDNPFLGKGWGWYKKTYGITGAHNIYLQLLCECGLFGTLPIVSIFAFWFFKTRKIVKDNLKGINNQKINPYLKFIFYSQVYILIYGLIGNPIYDYCFLIWYVISVALIYNSNVSTSNEMKRLS